MPKGDNIGNSFIGKNPPTVDVVEENLLGKITQDEDGGLILLMMEKIQVFNILILSNVQLKNSKIVH